jgi:hypothetical protein
MRQAHQPKHLITFLERSMLCARVRVWEGKGGSAHDRRCKAKRYLAGRSVHGNGRRRRPVCSRVRPGGQGSDRRRFGGACNRTNPRIGRDQLLSNLSGSGGSVIGDKPAKSAPNPCVRLAGLSEPRREMPAAAEKNPRGRARPTAQRCDRIELRPSLARQPASKWLSAGRPPCLASGRARRWSGCGSRAPTAERTQRIGQDQLLSVQSCRFHGRRCLSGRLWHGCQREGRPVRNRLGCPVRRAKALVRVWSVRACDRTNPRAGLASTLSTGLRSGPMLDAQAADRLSIRRAGPPPADPPAGRPAHGLPGSHGPDETLMKNL